MPRKWAVSELTQTEFKSIGMKFTSSNQGNNVCGNKVLVIHGLKNEIETQHISIVELIKET